MYLHFRKGAEYWELHEVFRKLILTGFLVFFEDVSHRAVLAILVCILALASLNYYRPHPDHVVFFIAQASFIITTFKFLAIIFLDTKSYRDAEAIQDNNWIGWLLIFLDGCFCIASILALIAVAWVMRQELKHKKVAHLSVVEQTKTLVHTKTFTRHLKTKVKRATTMREQQQQLALGASVDGSSKSGALTKVPRFSLSSKHMRKAIEKHRDNEHVTQLENTASKTLDLKLKAVEQMSLAASVRLQQRLQKRKGSVHRTNGVLHQVNKVVPMSSTVLSEKGEDAAPPPTQPTQGSAKKSPPPPPPKAAKRSVKRSKKKRSSKTGSNGKSRVQRIGSATNIKPVTQNDIKWAQFYENNPTKAEENGYTAQHYEAYKRKMSSL